MSDFAGNGHLNFTRPEDDWTDQCNLDPELKRQLLERGAVMWFMGRYILTAKGKRELEARKAAATIARERGITNYAPRPDNEDA